MRDKPLPTVLFHAPLPAVLFHAPLATFLFDTPVLKFSWVVSSAILPVALQHVDARQCRYSLLPQRPRLYQGLLSLSLSLSLSSVLGCTKVLEPEQESNSVLEAQASVLIKRYYG